MGNHSVHLETASGNYVVVKDGQVLHRFPTEGEAEAQVRSLDEAAKKEAKAEKDEAKHHEEEAPKANDKPHGRHR